MLAKRTYTTTHPWITFDLGSEKFSPQTWMLLGEATSKAKHIAGVPLAPAAAKTLYQVFLAKGARATTAIEGNTLTEEQVVAQVEGKLHLPPSQQYLQQEVQNIIDACNVLVNSLANGGPKKIDLEFCCSLNSMVLKNLELESGVNPGEIRHHSVVVGNVYRGAPPEDCAYLMEQMCAKIEEIDSVGEDRQHLAILTALFSHIYLALIHPFGDGNGRTARLLEYYILLRAGLPQPTGHLLSNHYNMTRSKYYSELDKISKSGGETRNFVSYALQGFVDGLKDQIKYIRNEQINVTWTNYVHGLFEGQKGVADLRRRALVLQLGLQKEPVKISELMDMNVRTAREYAGKTDKTMTRDINLLEDMQLIRRLPGRRVEACKDIIKAFLPWRAKHQDAA
ncbi:Fic family protein [Rhizobium sp. BK602]|uniref:Fic family protein n=1 Tax=Rhizobium sp. BK602 TaxID=2586986 RepID=UPI00160E11F9|nr:Fic family protein [Rhizobium sp. BK602]MBB3612028.1 Fic family protein [Rhizobium sp. BK602]